MAEYRKKFVAIDLETTHLDSREGRIMEVGAAEFEIDWANKGDRGYRAKVTFGRTFSSLVNPEIEVPETALMITGINKAELQVSAAWKEVKPKLEEFIGDAVIVGHNIGFDLGYLENQGLKLKNEILDTLVLARTLLPLESSHSLEALAEHFGVLKDAPHRALVDCQNAARVASEVFNAFLDYPLELQSRVKQILDKAGVNFTGFMKELPAVNNPLSAGPARKSGSGRPQAEREITVNFTDKTVYCYPFTFTGHRELLGGLSGLKKAAVIGVSHPTFLEDFPGQTLVNPKSALCSIRYSRMLKIQQKSPEFAKILVKIAILRALEHGLDLSRLKWAPEEVSMLPCVTVNPGICPQHGCEFAAMLEKPSVSPRLASLETVFGLGRDWHGENHPLPASPPLMLFDLAAIEDHFTAMSVETWSLKKIRNQFVPLFSIATEQESLAGAPRGQTETILNQLDLFFGVLHLVYLKRTGEYAENLVITESERQSERFRKLVEPARNLKNKLSAYAAALSEGKKMAATDLHLEYSALVARVAAVANFLENFFLEPDSEQIAWLKFNTSWVDLNLQPSDLAAEWKKFTANFSSTTIVDTVQPASSRTYYEQRLGLGCYEYKKCLPQPARDIPVKIFSRILNVSQQMDLFIGLPGRTLLLVPSEVMLNKLYQQLMVDPRAVGEDILAYKYSGNVGTLKKKLKGFRGQKLLFLLTMHALQKHWRVLPELSNLVIFKLPFEASGSKPALLGAVERSIFMDTILPRAVSQFHRIITSFLAAGGETKTIQILDPRLLTDYDQSFMKYFEEFSDFRISTV